VTDLASSPNTSSLGARCLDALFRRMDEQAISSSNRHMVDHLPPEAAWALFETMVSRADRHLAVQVPDDNGGERTIELGAVGRPRGDVIPFLVEEGREPSGQTELPSNRGTEGFASCLRDYFASGADRPRFLVTVTPRGNETQKSARDVPADRALVDLPLILSMVLDEKGVAPDDPLRRVARVYLAFQISGEAWDVILSRWESFVKEAVGLSAEEQGAMLPKLGCFLPDRSGNFADAPRVRILPESEDQKRRRPGDPLSDSRLFDNALLRNYLEEVFDNPIEDAEQILSEVFEDQPERAGAIAKGGRDGLDALDLVTFAGLDQVQRRREKNALIVDKSAVEGALHWQGFEQAGARILVVAATDGFRIRVPLLRGFNPRKERAQNSHVAARDGQARGRSGDGGGERDRGRLSIQEARERELLGLSGGAYQGKAQRSLAYRLRLCCRLRLYDSGATGRRGSSAQPGGSGVDRGGRADLLAIPNRWRARACDGNRRGARG
jgi:hypothetical protein